MARLTCNINDTINALEGIFSIPDSVANEMMTAQANVVAEKQKQVGREMGVYRTGETLDSITAENSARRLRNGWSIRVYPRGLRKKTHTAKGDSAQATQRRYAKKKGQTYNVRNAEVAFINEYGKKSQRARPFIRVANARCAVETTEAAMKVYDDWLKSRGF